MSCVSDCTVFRLVISFIVLLKLITTRSYSALTNSHTLQLIIACTNQVSYIFNTCCLAMDPNNVFSFSAYATAGWLSSHSPHGHWLPPSCVWSSVASTDCLQTCYPWLAWPHTLHLFVFKSFCYCFGRILMSVPLHNFILYGPGEGPLTQSTISLLHHMKAPRGDFTFLGRSARYTGASAPGNISIFLLISHSVPWKSMLCNKFTKFINLPHHQNQNSFQSISSHYQIIFLRQKNS